VNCLPAGISKPNRTLRVSLGSRLEGITNTIQVRSRATPLEVKAKIEEAFERNAEMDANKIIVEAHSGEVILHGTVRSWAEWREAERASWGAPGVIKVDNQLTISA
jgi:osmotically-inducible protein OsmY